MVWSSVSLGGSCNGKIVSCNHRILLHIRTKEFHKVKELSTENPNEEQR
uniref:Uncharacterized protein n=1 Tax=Lepeophtheirus salmonis TaxID=72036 RepID=A0A0K2U4G3_LEPSM